MAVPIEHHPRSVTRPLPFSYPTRAVFVPYPESGPSGQSDIRPVPSTRWSSRASRKNRYNRRPLYVTPQSKGVDEGSRDVSSAQKELIVLQQRVRRSEARFKIHLAMDVSFWVAVTFVLGSSVWIVNGFILFLPLLGTGSDNFPASAWSAFAGGTLFELGSYLMYVEALNAGHEELFGPALRALMDRANPAPSERTISPDSESTRAEKGLKPSGNGRRRRPVGFRWIGTGSWRELGFLACFTQMCAATIFWVSTIAGLPNVISGFPDDPPTAITDVFVWTPQVVGGTGFIVSSLLLMLEVQRKWWLPNLRSMGWHVGFWNLVGAVGFTLCGALGYASLSSSGVNYQSILSTFWGSWAFLIGSVIQLWEILWREDPSEEED